MPSQMEREARRAAIEGVRERIGAKPLGVWEPPADCVFLTSIENRFKGMKGGVTVQVGKRQAAVQIVDGTHSLSTEVEIEAYHQGEADRKQAARDAENRANWRCVVYPTPRPPKTEPPVPVDESPAAQLEFVEPAEPRRKQ